MQKHEQEQIADASSAHRDQSLGWMLQVLTAVTNQTSGIIVTQARDSWLHHHQRLVFDCVVTFD